VQSIKYEGSKKMSRPVRILGIAGSLRRGSYNRVTCERQSTSLLKALQSRCFELDGIPGFNQDEEQNHPPKLWN
jgi:chromate reductase, NAD(P)H dehydrogenase (quinone)